MDLLKGGTGQMSLMPSHLEPAGILMFFVIKYIMLNLTKCLLTSETFALIHWQALDVRKTKCTELERKGWHKIGFGKF